MKHILFFATLLLLAGSACKKSKKAQLQVTQDALIGNWTDEYALSSSMLPNTYSFQANGTYSRFYGITTEPGTYQINQAGSTASTLDITFSPATTSAPSSNAKIQITSLNRIVVYYNGSTAGRPFLRVP